MYSQRSEVRGQSSELRERESRCGKLYFTLLYFTFLTLTLFAVPKLPNFNF